MSTRSCVMSKKEILYTWEPTLIVSVGDVIKFKDAVVSRTKKSVFLNNRQIPVVRYLGARVVTARVVQIENRPETRTIVMLEVISCKGKHPLKTNLKILRSLAQIYSNREMVRRLVEK